jgi:serine kinase of HPr protein (carbohydrate metabolism regulator)
MKIAIDFDGVICESPLNKRDWDFMRKKPNKGAKDAINALMDKHDIWIFTARTQEEWGKIRKWCDKHKIPQLPITNYKDSATIYLDDRCIRFTNWADFCRIVL